MNGYDPIQGALSPVLRLGVHVSACLLVWALTLAIWPALQIPDACLSDGRTLSYWQSAFCSISTYAFCTYAIHHYLPGVSHPGGPRPQKLQRTPRWAHRTTRLPRPQQWRFANAQKSHELTMARMAGTSAQLTGEPAGRGIWITVEDSTQEKEGAVDESLVQVLASGGRSPGTFNPSVNPNSCDMPFRAQMIRNYLKAGNRPPSMAQNKEEPLTAKEAVRKAVHFYSMLQTDDGHWAGDYGGPLFLTPGFVVAWYIMGKPDRMFNKDEIEMIIHYMLVHQQEDGGWGTHIESPSTMFGTTMNYVALRLMGLSADHEACVQARTFILDNGGAIMTSSWAKLYLCMLGCMHWDGHNSVPPEMWLLPNWFPFHPGRMWCHARMVYLVSSSSRSVVRKASVLYLHVNALLGLAHGLSVRFAPGL